MARKAFSEQGLPSPEVRQQILQRAGMVLDEARDLMARLDRQETSLLVTGAQLERIIERTRDDQDLVRLRDAVGNAVQAVTEPDPSQTPFAA